MTTLGLNQTALLDPIAQREAALERQRQALAADTAERARLATADQKARLAYEEARGFDTLLLTDAGARLDASDDDLTGAPKSHRVARDAAVRAGRALAEHITQTGDLAARALRITDEAYVIAQDKFKMAHREAASEMLHFGMQLSKVLARVKRIERDAYAQFPEERHLSGAVLAKGAGLTPVGFAAGIFEATQTAIGRRSVWFDDVLVAALVLYPELSELLPPDEVAEVKARIDRIRTDRIIWFPMAPGWRTAGGWSATAQVDLPRLLSGPLRRELMHGL